MKKLFKRSIGIILLILITPQFVFAFESLSNSNNDTNSSRISFGTDISLFKHPWQVYLGGCGGVIISKKFILTAAHCIKNSHPASAKVTAGGDGNKDKLENLPRVKKIIMHPEYISWTSSSNRVKMVKHNDIAILELEDDITFTNSIQKINLPSPAYSMKNVYSNKVTVFITGWGRTNNSYYSSTQLQEVQITKFLPPADQFSGEDEDKFEKLLSDNPYYPDYDLFRAYMTGNYIGFYLQNKQGSCKGDSGGPMVDFTNKILIGITAHSDGDCGENKFGYYTNVKQYINWINSVIN